MKNRLDIALTQRGLTSTRSQAKSYIKLGYVKVRGEVITKPGFLVGSGDKIEITATEQYVSRAALKLASVAEKLSIDFKNKIVLDVGSSTGGFTDFALKHGAQKVIAVDVGTNQLHQSLHENPKIELHEQTDIRNVRHRRTESREKSNELEKNNVAYIHDVPDIVLADVSFISLRDILPHVSRLITHDSTVVVMLKPQFEAGVKDVNKGVIKNDSIRRKILKDFEAWAKNSFQILGKADSEVAGSKGNLERFYLLSLLG
jgi:23S rRNA (cytidine1920-2'-O)/16S rRNA (cytidine1409-2'-O)-methyltransferase